MYFMHTIGVARRESLSALPDAPVVDGLEDETESMRRNWRLVLALADGERRGSTPLLSSPRPERQVGLPLAPGRLAATC